jgi:hypothetical protein
VVLLLAYPVSARVPLLLRYPKVRRKPPHILSREERPRLILANVSALIFVKTCVCRITDHGLIALLHNGRRDFRKQYSNLDLSSGL